MAERTWEDNKQTVFISFQQVWNKSFQDKFDEFEMWFYPTFLHWQLLRCITESYDRKEVADSLVFHRCLGWRRTLQWCIISAYSGVYEAIARELRFIIEDLAQALYIDQKLGDSGLIGKTRTTSILEDERLRGKRLIERIDMDGKSKQEMKRLYDVLSGYVHPSAALIQQILAGGQFYFRFDETQFDSSLDMYSRTCDAVIARTVSQFPQAVARLLQIVTIDDLRRHGYSQTAQVCEMHSQSKYD